MKKKDRYQKPMSVRLLLIPWKEGDGYTIEAPDLPGCISEGYSLEHAVRMIRDAIECYLDSDADVKKFRVPRRQIEKKIYLGWVDKDGKPIELAPTKKVLRIQTLGSKKRPVRKR